MIDFKIGKPYNFRKYNCWDYVREIRQENGIKTRQYQPQNLDNAFEIITAEMQKLGNGLTKVIKPKNFDIVIGHNKTSKRNIYHCGLFFDNQVIHCDRKLRQVVAQDAQGFYRSFDGVKFWR